MSRAPHPGLVVAGLPISVKEIGFIVVPLRHRSSRGIFREQLSSANPNLP
jgi:hypothetical protein